MEQASVPIPAVGTRHRVLLWIVLAIAVSLVTPIGFGLWSVTASNLREGTSVGVAFFLAIASFENPLREILMLLVLSVVIAATTADLVIGYPRVHTHRKVRILLDGLELRTCARWWHRGGGVLLPWEDIQAVSVSRDFPERGIVRRARPAPRDALDIYVRGGNIEGVPDFATTERRATPIVPGVTRPTNRVRVTGSQKGMSASVAALASALDAARPDLVARDDSWQDPRLPADPTLFALPAPVWLDFRHSPWQGFATLGGVLLFTAGCYIAIQAIAGSGWGGLSSILIVILAIPLLLGVIATPVLVLFLPRALVRCGILIDADGVELVEKRRLGVRLVRGRIPWSDVQAVVAVTRQETNLYLHADTQFHKPGVGLSAGVTLPQQADSSPTPSHVTFPALRVRLRHRTAAQAEPDVAAWPTLSATGQESYSLPPSQLPTALSAARPDLWHGASPSGIPRKPEP